MQKTKNKATKPKVVKKMVKKEFVVKEEKEIVIAETPKSLGMVVNSTPMNVKQLLAIHQKTDPRFIYEKKGRGGNFSYVPVAYVQQKLNQIFGWAWDFEVKSHGVEIESKQIWVLGKLTVKIPANNTPTGYVELTKEQFGQSEVKMLKTGGVMNLGNDLKAAASDALKKCASQFGIASDVYGKNEYTELGITEMPKEMAQASIQPTNGIDYISKIKIKLFALGAKDKWLALEKLFTLTGTQWNDFEKTPEKEAEAKTVYANLLMAGK